MIQSNSQTWLHNKFFDLIFILSPSFISVFIVLLFQNSFEDYASMPLWAWVVFVLCIDVSHVYSTLFRTYFHKKEFDENKTLYTILPIAVFFIGVILHTISASLFWRILAYSAVFHFIRQQYGFLRLYSRNETVSILSQRIDKLFLYTSTIYPIVYWHVHLPRNFRWFTEGDFIKGLPTIFEKFLFVFYIGIILIYLVKEILQIYRKNFFNLPKNLILFGTAFSWYTGIVLLNGDMVFTITNVVSHGIPYMALVWAYGKRQADIDDSERILNTFHYKVFFSKYSFPIFILALLFFGYIEEGFWAGLVWREHLEIFGFFSSLPVIRDKDTLSLLVPLLTLPQATHYILDGFIWRLRDTNSNWIKLFFK